MRTSRILLAACTGAFLSACSDRPAEVATIPDPIGQQGYPIDTSPASPKKVAAAAAATTSTVPRSDGPASIALPKLQISTSEADIAKGQTVFATKGCIACHKVGGGKLVGPDLKGIYQRRNEAWVARMILKPEVMLKDDEAAKELFRTYLVPMANQSVDPEKELPFILAYLKAESK